MALRFQRSGVRNDGKSFDPFHSSEYFSTPYGFTPGNANVVLGGYWNWRSEAWTSPIAGATALTLALTIKPEDPFTPVPDGGGWVQAASADLINQWADVSSYSLFRFWHSGAGRLSFTVEQDASGGGVTQKCETDWRALVPGVWNRLVARWRGSDHAMSIWVNGIDRTNYARSTGGVSSIYTMADGMYPSLTIGSVDQMDSGAVAGNYAEAAIWTAYLSDTDTRKYGRGASPNLLGATGRCRYAKLRMEGEDATVALYTPTPGVHDSFWHGYIWEEWTNGTGYAYGHDLYTHYNYGGGPAGDFTQPYQGFFPAFNVAPQPHPTVFYSEPAAYLPVAAFTYTQSSVGTPDAAVTVQFTDTSLDATGWTWDFGDGSPVSHAQSPSHAYADAGATYLVTLTVTGNAMTSEPTTRWITTLYASVSARFGYVQDPFTLDLRVLDSSIGPATTRTWSWGDGTPDTVSTTNYALHSYATDDTYTVTLTVSNPLSGPSSLSRSVTLIPLAAQVTPMVTTDATLLPQREFQLYERTAKTLGKRSGTTYTCTTWTQLSNAMAAARYGDTISIDHTTPITMQNALRPTDLRTWTLNDSTPRMPPMAQVGALTAAELSGPDAPTALGGTPLASGCLPSWVLVTSDGALPDIPVIRITTETEENYPILAASARIQPSDAAEMATLHLNGNVAVALDGEHFPSGYFYFRGINWVQPDDLWGRSFFTDLAGYPYSSYFYDRNRSNEPDHLVFQQCLFDADPYRKGRSGGLMAGWSGAYLGFINCFFDNMFVPSGGGDPHLLFSVSSVGPHLLENNIFWALCAIWFCGGSGTTVVGGLTQDWVARRNFISVRPEWINSECNPEPANAAVVGTYTVTLDASGYAGIMPSRDGHRGPRTGDYLVDRTTGMARVCTASELSESGNQTWVFGWPTLPAGPILAFWQRWSEEPDTSPTLYNSGIATPMPLATTWAAGNSSRVTFDTALPVDVATRVAAGENLYFYLNNTYFGGIAIGGTPTHRTATDPLDTTWGPDCDRTSEALSGRKRIASIDPDRRGLTLANPYFADPVSGAGKTFPFSIVRFSGLYCDSWGHNKGSYENKLGRRFLIEGNVWTGLSGRMYVNNQAITWSNMPCFAYARITPTKVTLLDGQTWPVNPYYNEPAVATARNQWGPPGCWTTLMITESWANEYSQRGRAVLRTISDHEALLVPPDAGVAGFNQDDYYIGAIGMLTTGTPWAQLKDVVMRYNVADRSGAPNWKGTSTYGGGSLPGGYLSMHDNISPGGGDHSFTVWLSVMGLDMSQGTPIFSPYYCPGLTWSENYGATPRRNDNSLIRFTHNTYVRDPSQTNMRLWGGEAAIYPKASGLILDDNIAVMAKATQLWVTGSVGTYPGFPIANPTQAWGASVSSTKNVFAGPNVAARRAIDFFPYYPDNATVSAPDAAGGPGAAVGFVDYQGSLYDLANYALADIATGTADIAADGMSATTATLPLTVTPTQFFRTTSAPTVFKRLTGAGPDFGLTLEEPWWNESQHSGLNGSATSWVYQPGSADYWAVNPGGYPLGGCYSYPGEDTGPLAWARCTNSLGGTDHEVSATFYCGDYYSFLHSRWMVITRKNADDVASFYFVGNKSATDGQLQVGLMQNGVVTYYHDLSQNLGRLPIQVTVGLRSIGTHHYVLFGGALVYDWVDDHWTGGSCGGIAASLATNVREARFRDITLRGNMAGLRMTWGGDPHPEANSTRSFVVTFKGTATDGSDPGASIATVSAMVQGILDVGPLPTPPTCTIDTPTTDSTYTATTSTISLAGHATDDVGVTSVTWVNVDGGTNGSATGTTDWSITDISLVPGSNLIRVTAHNAANLGGSDTLTVTYGSALTVEIQTPTTGPTYNTDASVIALTGIASYVGGVTSVTWSNSRGGSGTATGTDTWAFTATLLPGTNIITVTAHNAVPQTATDTLTVTYTAPTIARTKFRASSKVTV